MSSGSTMPRFVPAFFLACLVTTVTCDLACQIPVQCPFEELVTAAMMGSPEASSFLGLDLLVKSPSNAESLSQQVEEALKAWTETNAKHDCILDRLCGDECSKSWAAGSDKCIEKSKIKNMCSLEELFTPKPPKCGAGVYTAPGASPSPSATNGAATNGAATNGAATNGAATNGAATSGAATNGAATNGNGASGNGASGNEASGNGAKTSTTRPQAGDVDFATLSTRFSLQVLIIVPLLAHY